MIVTGVGGLPHADPSAAARFVMETAGLPYLPQLPNRHPEESMLRQWADGMCGCGAVDDDVLGLRYGAPEGPRHEAFAGAGALLELLPAGVAVKSQATGPVTLAIALLAAGHPREGVLDCVVPALTERIGRHVVDVTERCPGAAVSLVLDEPALAGNDDPRFPFSLGEAGEALGVVLAATDGGVHCCGDTDWEWLSGLRPRRLSLDVSALGVRFISATDALAAALHDGMLLAWGVVPVSPPPFPSAVDLARRYGEAITRLVVAGAPLEPLRDTAWFTAGCGLSGLSVEHAEQAAGRVVEVVRHLGG